MKKIFLAALLLAGFTAVPARADIITDAVKQVLQERLEKTIDQDFKDTDYWKGLLGNVANGTPEVTVQQIMDDYNVQSMAKDTGMKILAELVPEAAGPLGLLITAGDAAQKYTRDMLDFYKQRHLQDFTDQVLKPSKTTKELKANYDRFIEEYVNSGISDTNVLYAERKDQETLYYNTFLQMFGELARAEKVEQARKMAQQAVTRKLKNIGTDARQEVDMASEYLKSAGLAVTLEALKKYRTDADFKAQVKTAATRTAMDAKKEAENKPDPAVKPGKPATPAAAVPPVVSGGGTIFALAREIRNSAQEDFETRKYRPLDYSSLVSAYGQAADRVLANSSGYGTFAAEAEQLNAAANMQGSACTEASGPGSQIKECRDALGRYYSATEDVRKKLNDYSMNARKEADRLIALARAQASPLQFAREKSDKLHYAYSDAMSKASCSPAGSTADFEKKYLPACDQAIGAYAGALAEARAGAEELRNRITAYETVLNKTYSDYSDNFTRNNSLLEMAGAAFYGFKEEFDAAAGANQALASDYFEIGEPRILSQARLLADLQRTRSKSAEQLAMNKAYLSAHGGTADKLEGSLKVTLTTGLAMNLETFNPSDYYKSNLNDFVSGFLAGAIPLLSPSTKGYSPEENIPYKEGYLRVWDAPKYPFYLSVAAHEAKLKEFRKQLAEVREMQLEKRAADLAAAGKSEKADFERLEKKFDDTQALHSRFEALAKVGGKLTYATAGEEYFQLFYGQAATLAEKTLGGLEKDYADRIALAKAEEAKMEKVFTRYQTEDYKDEKGNYRQDLMDARVGMNCKKWECSSAVWQAYNKMQEATNAKWQADAQKFSPVKALTVNGRPVQAGVSGTLELADKDLINGEIEVKGELHPNTVGLVSDVKLSLDGQSYDKSLGGAQNFSYAFKPRQGQTYYIALKPSLLDGKAANVYPAADHSFAVTYTNTGADSIKDFYARFKAAYESRSSAQVMSLVSASWTAGDGTTASDLEETLRNNFRLYDEIKFDFSGLEISRSAGGSRACYNVTITSRIFKRNLKHEEKSGVCEELGADEAGRIRITGNFSGSYWYVK